MSLIWWDDGAGKSGLLSPDGVSLTDDPSCCCGGDCCDRLYPPGATPAHLPETLTLTITSVTDCGCVDGTVITLTWDVTFNAWLGTGPGGGACALLSEEWRVSCSINPDATSSCQNLQLSIGGVTSCIMSPAFPLVGCSCNPISLEYDVNVSGLGCCDGSMDGSGTITVAVTE